MQTAEPDTSFVPAGFDLLVRTKCRALANQTREVVNEAPVKVFATCSFIAVIWFALYELFRRVFEYFRENALESAIAVPLLFNFFFVALLALLTISNAILAYGTLFAHGEAAYLLSSPLRRRTFVSMQFAESLFFSSWSLLLLGMPLMMAIARVQNEAWFFYPMFVLFFLVFIPIPGAAGLVLAWAVGRFLPRTSRRVLLYSALAAMLAAVVWGLRSVRDLEWINEQWLDAFFARMSLIEASALPSTWVTRGIEAAVSDRRGDALRYLGVLAANALFLSWLGVHLVAAGFQSAYDRASTARGRTGQPAMDASGGAAGRAFFFLPRPARLIAAKDLRTFVRDPMQWSQLAILFGLMALYLLHTPRFATSEPTGRWAAMIPFLNLTAISFILATFTSRFVFPLVSLEGQQLWLIGLLPISRTWILVAKFAFAMAVTLSVASGVTLLASYILRVGPVAMFTYWAVTASVCYGLCGFAVGLGARFPVFTQRNPARIANGLGGTINLIASVLLVALMLMGMGYVTWRVAESGLTARTDPKLFALCGLIVLTGLTAGSIAMVVGARHLRRIEV